jgi:succinyl-CoA synthetase (ADP-forming) beta subunit (EC 6.2.1.5)
MNLHEYQAKELFARYGVPVPEGRLAATPEAARAAAVALGGRVVVKAQVHAGGRGKAGGVVIAEDPDAAAAAAGRLLGSRLVTPQTGAAGLPVGAVWVERPSAIAREIYVSGLIDRSRERVAFMASAAGGMDIEAVAAATPEQIRTVHASAIAGLQAYQARELGFFLGLDKAGVDAFTRILLGLYRLLVECDASLVEINPLIVTDDGRLLALDAKVNLDDNALYRQKPLAEQDDPTQTDARERAARRFDLNYIQLDGNIGCMVNGAGLAMATMDLIQLEGGRPANFLDVGGGTTAERVTEAFKLITASDEVKAILVNIFGGIVRCDLIAEGIVSACRQVGLKIPVVARLQGTNMEQGQRILGASGLAITPAADLAQAARLAVAAAGGTQA